MMTLEYARKATFITAVVLTGLNLFQLTSSYQYALKQIEEFRESLHEDENTVTQLPWLNFLFYLFLPAMFVYLLYSAGFNFHILIIISIKLILGSAFSVHLQKSIIRTEPYRPIYFYMGKVDSIVNIFIMLFLMYCLVYL